MPTCLGVGASARRLPPVKLSLLGQTRGNSFSRHTETSNTFGLRVWPNASHDGVFPIGLPCCISRLPPRRSTVSVRPVPAPFTDPAHYRPGLCPSPD